MSKDTKNQLQILPQFDHKLGASRHEKITEFVQLLGAYMSTKHGHYGIASLLSLDTDHIFWGLHEFLGNHLVKGVARHLEDHIKWFTNQKYQGLWFKAQSELLALLLVNFKSHDSAVLVNYSADKTHKVWQPIIAQQDDDDFLWPDTLWNAKLKWLPFGTMCFHAICERYQDEGVTDCISKIRDFDKARLFNPLKVQPWAEGVEKTWLDLRRIVQQHDPDYLAAMQILLSIDVHGNEPWKTFTTWFASTKGTKPFSVSELLDAVRARHKLIQSSVASAADMPVGSHATASAAAYETQSTCSIAGCTTPLQRSHHKFCPTHYKKRDSTDDKIPDKVAARLKVKDDAKRKKSFAKKKAKRQELLKAGKAALAQAQVADGRSYDKEASVGDKHSSASLHDSSSSTQVSVSRTKMKLPRVVATGGGTGKKKGKKGKPKIGARSASTAAIVSFNPELNGSFTSHLAAAPESSATSFGSLQFGM